MDGDEVNKMAVGGSEMIKSVGLRKPGREARVIQYRRETFSSI